MQFKNLFFKSPTGIRLSARLDLPVDGKPASHALFAHCFTCNKNYKAIGNISRALTREGIAVLRFDFTGLGESEGDFADTNFSSNVEDLIAAAEFLQRDYQAPKILIGHSLGGAAVLQAAGHIPSAKAVVTIGAPSDPEHVTRHLGSTRRQIETHGEAEVSLAGRTFKIKKQFLDDLKGAHMEAAIKGLNKALLILHSPVDTIVDIKNAASIFKAARHPKSFISLDQADHLLSRQSDSLYAGALIAAWAHKYVESPQAELQPADPADNRVIARIGRSGFLTEINAGGHSLSADEPLSVGGTNLGPSPYNLLMAGLGACSAMTLRMYADRKGWSLDSVAVALRHQKVHAADCSSCETQAGYLDLIDRDIVLNGSLDKEQRERLLEIAERCPVHRSLHSEIVIDTKLKDSI